MRYVRMFLMINVLLAVSVGLVSCYNSSSSSPNGGAKGQLLFEGTWKLVRMNGQSPALERPITIHFADGTIGGFSGCNSYGGAYRYEANGNSGGHLYVSEVFMTQMACEEGMMQLESDYVRILQTPLADEYDGGSNLTLRSGNEQLVYVRE